MNNQQTPKPDQDLLLRASQGDAEAFGDLYEKYLNSIYRYVHYRLSSVEEAEDLTEQIFLKVWENLRDESKASQIQNFRAWLYRVAHNQVIDYHRKKQPISVDIQEHTGLLGRSDHDTEGDVQKKLDHQDVLSAIQTLDQQSQDVIMLRFMKELSHTEVAEILDLEPGHIRVLQHRALTQLRKVMRDENHE